MNCLCKVLTIFLSILIVSCPVACAESTGDQDNKNQLQVYKEIDGKYILQNVDDATVRGIISTLENDLSNGAFVCGEYEKTINGEKYKIRFGSKGDCRYINDEWGSIKREMIRGTFYVVITATSMYFIKKICCSQHLAQSTYKLS